MPDRSKITLHTYLLVRAAVVVTEAHDLTAMEAYPLARAAVEEFALANPDIDLHERKTWLEWAEETTHTVCVGQIGGSP